MQDTSPMATSTPAASPTSHLAIWKALHNVTSSPESAVGAWPSDSPAGLMNDLCGPDHAPANLSAQQAQAQGLLTSGIYGPTSTTSSASADLQLCLASRLRAQLASAGSTLYALTWKERATPLGRPICALRASAPRTSDSVSTGWPTPCTQDGPKGGPGQGTDRLPGAVALTGYPLSGSQVVGALLFMALIMVSGFSVIPYITIYTTTNLGLAQEQVPLIYLVGGVATSAGVPPIRRP